MIFSLIFAKIISKPMTNPFDSLPLIRAGFASPADEHMEPDLDYNALFKRNPSATMARRVQGHSMVDAFIPHNSIVVIDKSIKPINNSIVAVTLDGETIIKHIVSTPDGRWLLPANKRYKSMRLEDGMDFSVWGTATYCIIELFDFNRYGRTH